MVLILLTSPANVEAAQLYKENIKEYERKVKVSVPLIPLPASFADRCKEGRIDADTTRIPSSCHGWTVRIRSRNPQQQHQAQQRGLQRYRRHNPFNPPSDRNSSIHPCVTSFRRFVMYHSDSIMSQHQFIPIIMHHVPFELSTRIHPKSRKGYLGVGYTRCWMSFKRQPTPPLSPLPTLVALDETA